MAGCVTFFKIFAVNNKYSVFSFTADWCPYRLQNKEYCEYLLKALYCESRDREDWEKEKLPFDAIDYQLDETSEVDVQVSKVLKEGENIRTLEDYKSATS